MATHETKEVVEFGRTLTVHRIYEGRRTTLWHDTEDKAREAWRRPIGGSGERRNG